MVFDYPSKPHSRRHGPAGYANYTAYKPWLRDEFVFRCAYCLVRELWYPSASSSFSVDHFVPQVAAPDRALDYDNLIYACLRCNSWKQDNDVLDPCHIALGKHLAVHEDGTIEALTPEGAEHMRVLDLNDPDAKAFRNRIFSTLRRLRALPDEESKEVLRQWLGFPDDLPNLAAMRPPKGNARREGLAGCYYNQKQEGRLPETY